MPRLSPSVRAPDRTLVKGLNEGDETAFAALYDEYGEALYDYVLSMTGDVKVAADIVHDTFIDAGRRAPRMRDHLYLSSWLYGAARRRCIRRGRAKVLFWDRESEFSDIPFLDRAEQDDPGPDWPPSDELHELFHGTLGRLDPVDQEVLLLAFRHGLRPGPLGAALGLTTRRAATRVRRAETELAAALQKEIDRADRACAAETDAVDAAEGGAPEPDDVRGLGRVLRRRPPASPADPATARHAAACPGCLRRGRVTGAALFGRAPAPVLPAALRHRVMHTATDPELAGHRADIAARGGTLTPAGLPSQPDVPSPFTRRWLFRGSGMAVALVAALVAAFVIGPGIDGDSLSWPPFRSEPQPSITRHTPPNASGTEAEPSQAPGADGPGRSAEPPVQPQTEERTPQESASPTPSAPTPPAPPPAQPGALVVAPGTVELYGTKSASISLAADSGPVTWTAMTSTSQLVLSEMQGGIDEGGTDQVTIRLKTFIVGLPGQGTLTFTDSEGATQQVKVVWGISLL
ncbi:sigma-70 family RNA polymerase sigma factor [Actinomadura sp. GC306]|uniref:RNA polymerase sigma factor n=1 Tax=Actinomadura sp. GC306 TaxID=2530367 RepID=UPI00104994F4|nr:sigma-70 family RNA polymerase sigma factor [Actinomadura sp. GC306]TDC60085.1 sigma-70 family RNA polymerase sigma factor [Actinomadura sp. GC306]